jgi:hypothetical protein
MTYASTMPLAVIFARTGFRRNLAGREADCGKKQTGAGLMSEALSR